MTDAEIKNIKRLIPRALRVDRRHAQQKLEKLTGAKSRVPEKKKRRQLADLALRLEKSADIKSRRYDQFPAPGTDPRLPISQKKDTIVEALRKHRVVIVAGATGSGKSTQIPKYCVAAGLGKDGRVGCTQPRRIAAMSLSRRISDELGRPPGDAAGYKIRFADKTGDEQLLKIMTDGILLAEAQRDPWLNEYDALVIDEAHERSLNIDFILGLARKLLDKRADLRIVITSATIDTEKFSAAFDEAPVIEVSGRLYPVEVKYRPYEEGGTDSSKSGVETYVEKAVAEVDRIVTQGGPGDVLVFMPTTADIRDACGMIEGRRHPGTAVFSLFAKLPAAGQAAVFADRPERKIIVATNIAETSLTIPGIRFVVDTGLARISYYNPRTRITSLSVRKISKSSALQREGRCGRVADGVCVRLYSENDFMSRHMFTPPEILRANLADVILRMMSLKLGSVREFPFVDPPQEKSIKDGYDVLEELGAITKKTAGKKPKKKHFRLTQRGRLMARIPVDPRLSRILIAAGESGCIDAAVVIVAALSISDPREVPAEKAKEAEAVQARFLDEASDFMTLHNFWDAAQGKKSGELKRFCREHYLSLSRMREWQDIYQQIKELARANGLYRRPESGHTDRSVAPAAFYEALHKAILSGYLSQIAVKKEKNVYQAAGDKEVMVFPGSALFNREKDWIVSAEFVETGRLYARTAAAIKRKWIAPLAGELCRFIYFDARWSKNRGEVVADRKTTLFGLTVAADTAVDYGRVNPTEAADKFIRRALVAGEVNDPPPFLVHNRQLIDEVVEIEDRLRRREFLATEDDLFQFYKERLPETVAGMKSLREFLAECEDDSFLCLDRQQVMQRSPEEGELARFPESITAGSRQLACDYLFDPTDEKDGVTVSIPAAAAPDVPAERFDWLVPGLLEEKIVALIKGLPKTYRKDLVPVNRTVSIIYQEMPRGRWPLLTELSDFIRQRFGVAVPASAWRPDQLPDHLKMRLAITDDQGREICASRKKQILRQAPDRKQPSTEIGSIRKQWEKTGLFHDTFPDLPESVPVDETGGRLVYPALTIEEDRVSLRIFENRGRAAAAHRQAVGRLLSGRLAREMKFLKRDLRLADKAAEAAVYFGGKKSLEDAMADRLKDKYLCLNIRRRADFDSQAAGVFPDLYERAEQLRKAVKTIIEQHHALRGKLFEREKKARAGGKVAAALAGLRREAVEILPERFLQLYDDYRLEQIPRYLNAVMVRVDQAVENYPKYRQKTKQVAWAGETLERLIGELGPETSPEKQAAVENFFWMVQEYKISVFAQQIKTDGPISAKRLKTEVQKIDQMI